MIGGKGSFQAGSVLKRALKAYFRLWLTLFILVLSGCGGGGGGGVGNDLVYTGRPTQASLTSVNAIEMALGAYNGGPDMASLSLPGASLQALTNGRVPRQSGLLQYGEQIRRLADKITFTSQTAATPLSIQTATNTILGPCGGSAVLTLNVETTNGIFNGSLNYANYCEEGITAAGNLSLSGRVDLVTLEPQQMTISFKLLTLSNTDQSATISGTMAFSYALPVETSTLNYLLRDDASGKICRIENYIILTTVGVNQTETQYQSGRYFQPDLGYVDLASSSSFVEDPTALGPSSGELLLSGANLSKTSLRAIASNAYEVSTDTNGDGTFDWNSGLLHWSSINAAPLADAGLDLNVETGTQVVLDGSGSSDPEGGALTYSWSLVSKPFGSSALLINPTLVNPRFTADYDGSYMLSLVVSDATMTSTADMVTVTAATSNYAPVANAGSDQNVTTGSLVSLDGSASTDAETSPLSYSWSFASVPSGSSALLSDPTAVNPSFTADLDGLYTLNLVVNDGLLSSAVDSVVVRASPSVSAIQLLIDSATDGETIQVAPGTYYGTIDFKGKAIRVESLSGPAVTIIDGNLAGPVVSFITGEGASSILSGFTIRNGRASDEGGGVSIQSASPTLTNNIITMNQACTGSGIAIGFGSPLIQGNRISDNVQAGCSGGIGGGGISLRGSAAAQILENTISNNSTGSSGGGISLFAAGTPIIRGNIISGNQSASGGGIELVNFSDALIVQNLIFGNTAGSGGGIHWLVPSGNRGPLLVNNTIADNDSLQGSGIYADGYDVQTRLVNNLIIGKSGQTAVYCGDFNDLNPPLFDFNNIYTQGGLAYGGFCTAQTGLNGNLSLAPLFVAPASGNYHLHSSSPAVDAGDNSAPDLPATDPDGDLRILDGNNDSSVIIDMGWDEYAAPL
ncbi:PKD domain-containing protein [Geopsychrobacter electrodiphilus]|uniref:PKD domain-containing protein n=1 Tax=Geopsychrobacter electrodiphilus TaxID=225196 RepID=UPI0003A8E5E2|nr:right-handed parallel beta-helix repeat-containing protein [Geopsychrobacter electrodiphilus]